MILHPDWPAPEQIKALCTTRKGGHSLAPYDSLNLATHVGDDPERVRRNRAELARYLPTAPVWLNQTHSNRIINLDEARQSPGNEPFDGSISTTAGQVCALLTADCLPLLLTNTAGTVVAAVHAGWRGLAAGIIENCLNKSLLRQNRSEVLAWLGPAISQAHFEVGDEVRDIFVALSADNRRAFVAHGSKWRADIYALASNQLKGLGVEQIYAGEHCTYAQPELFHSYRRDGTSGRMASCIWIEP